MPVNGAYAASPLALKFHGHETQRDWSTPDIADLTELLRPYPAQELEVYPVRTVVNRANAEGAGLVEAVGEPA